MKEENRKIAKNTIIVYSRLAVTTILGLLSSRFVLKALGASDFGLYNVVGAVVVMFSFLTSALYGTTTRFINYEQGKKDGNVNKIFNISLAIHLIFAIISLLILESVGLFYVNNYLNVVDGKENDAMFVFQISTLAACIGIVGIPFRSLYIVHEKFSITAIVEMLSSILKFLLIVVLLYYQGNALRFYSISMALVILLSNLIYFFDSRRRWPSFSKFRLVKSKYEYKEMLIFNNYNLLGAAALIVRNQGSNILINFYFGTVVNAAYAIAYTIQSYITSFVGNFDTASAPQITQSFSRGDRERTFFLTATTCRICILLTLVLLFPVFTEIDFILNLWLDNVPEGTTMFCQCTLLIALISSTSGGLKQLIDSTGRLKWFIIQYSLLYAIALLLGYVLYACNFPPYTVTLLYFFADTISRIIQLYLLHRLIDFDVKSFVKHSYIRPLLVLIMGVVYVLGYNYIEILSRNSVINILVSTIYMMFLVFLIGLKKSEKNIVLSKLF